MPFLVRRTVATDCPVASEPAAASGSLSKWRLVYEPCADAEVAVDAPATIAEATNAMVETRAFKATPVRSERPTN